MSQHVSRREFLGRSAAAGAALAGVGYWSSLAPAVSKSPNEKLNIALFGVGKGHSDAQACASENIAVVCDVDEARARHSLKEFKGAKYSKDYRKVLEDRSLDAVIVATPDHTHAVIGIMAMKLGMHCFCQKPLTRTVEEARLMARVANEMKVATQMGNQGISADGFRAAVDMIRGGQLGEIRQVHCWTDRPLISVGWRQGMGRPEGTPPVPQTLDWDVWLGPAPERPYNPAYHPGLWRGYWDFGTGALGDMGCHTISLPYYALNLGSPTSISAETTGATSEMPPAQCTITYQFPARGEQPPVELVWYDGGRKPDLALAPGQKQLPSCGALIIGSQGTMFVTDAYGAHWRLLPEDKLKTEWPSAVMPRSPGHYVEWIRDAKGGQAAVGNFNYGAQLTEVILLGHLSTRVGKPLTWDPVQMRFSNAPEADVYLKGTYRKGFELGV